MEQTTINLTLFQPKYRQALLFTMIEGLVDGEGFLFIDDRAPDVIESELMGSGLAGYSWKKGPADMGNVSYAIFKGNLKKKGDGGCCGCCGG